MDSEKKEQQFDAIYMAITLGHVSAARCVFEASLNQAVNNKLDQIIKILEMKNLHFLIMDIEILKEQ
jgi:hypothetical protein